MSVVSYQNHSGTFTSCNIIHTTFNSFCHHLARDSFILHRIQCAFTHHAKWHSPHARGPHSVRIHASTFAIIRIHSRRTAFSDTSYAIHSLSFITVYIHFRHNSHSKRATFNTDIIHGHSHSYTNCHIHVQPHSRYIHRAAGARPPQPQRASFNRTRIQCSFIFIHHGQHS